MLRRSLLQGILATATLAWAPLRFKKPEISDSPPSALEQLARLADELQEETGMRPTTVLCTPSLYDALLQETEGALSKGPRSPLHAPTVLGMSIYPDKALQDGVRYAFFINPEITL